METTPCSTSSPYPSHRALLEEARHRRLLEDSESEDEAPPSRPQAAARANPTAILSEVSQARVWGVLAQAEWPKKKSRAVRLLFMTGQTACMAALLCFMLLSLREGLASESVHQEWGVAQSSTCPTSIRLGFGPMPYKKLSAPVVVTCTVKPSTCEQRQVKFSWLR